MSVFENWQDVIDDIAAWQARQFPETTVIGARNHLRREANVELEKDPNDPEEWADALFMAIQGGWKAAGDIEKFLEVVAKKLEKNERRQWPDKPDADNVYEHVKPTTAEDASRLVPKPRSFNFLGTDGDQRS